jgi:purine-binding chemotaxis protein CheW
MDFKINKINIYVNFRLGNENYAIPITFVIEIIKSDSFIKITNSSDSIKGVIIYRGKIIPVLDLRKRINMNNVENAGGMVILVDMDENSNNCHMGLWVDKVENIVEFKDSDIRKSPDLKINCDKSFLDGSIAINSRIITLLNFYNVLNIKELSLN